MAAKSLLPCGRKGAKPMRRFASTLQRGNYAKLTDRHATFLERLLGPGGVETEDLDGYNTDWLKSVKGESKLVVKPKNVNEVSKVLSFCHEENLAVVPQGGNTGLVSGSVPIFDEIILSLSKINQIYEIDPLSGTVTCGAGAVLEQVQKAVEEEGLTMPYDLGSKGSCQIGGNISTCAGGLRLIRYGSMLSNTLGLQAVKADGTILDCQNKLRKDNTGYHLRQLFIGAEGTLGVVTAATINCPMKPTSVNLAFLGLKSYQDIVSTSILARQKLSETISALEMIDSESFDVSTSALGLRRPLASPHSFYMMIETHGSSAQTDKARIEELLEEAMSKGLVEDCVSTDQPSTLRDLWKLRESLAEGTSRGVYLYTYDVTLPLPKAYNIVTDMRQRLAQESNVLSVSGYGHIGDGNIHVNIRADKFDPKLLEKIEPFVYEWTKSNDGSISSEHGIGSRKAKYLPMIKSPAALHAMKTLKRAMDPKQILNPYKVIYPL